ncbi:MAG: tol-pal system protein YbgF [Micavibrio sp.]|nr:MAG: tol-pal system protein YbgF [Micavibrio sp.]
MAGFAGFSPNLSHAQSSNELADRLQRLETDVRTLNRAVYSQEGAQGGGYASGGDPSANANAEIRVQQLEVELRSLTGQMEQQTFEIRQLREQLERATSDLELRIQDLESGRSASATRAPKYTAKPPSQVAPPPQQNNAQNNIILDTRKPQNVQPSTGNATGGGRLGTINQNSAPVSGGLDHAAAAYENAFALLKGSNFDAAEKEFGNFLSQYPDHVLSSNAKYWYGETFYVRADYERAARIFAESYQQAPRGAKAQDNLLKLGMSLAGMGNKKDACTALRQLNKENPGGTTPVLRRGQQEMNRLGC